MREHRSRFAEHGTGGDPRSKSSALVCCHRSRRAAGSTHGHHHPRTARAAARAELTRAILDSARDPAGRGRPGGAVGARRRPRPRHGVLGRLPLLRRAATRCSPRCIIEAYDDLGDAVETADARRRRSDLRGRLAGHGASALRAWALAHPHQYALTYGSPVPGYAAPDRHRRARHPRLARAAGAAPRRPAGRCRQSTVPARVSGRRARRSARCWRCARPALTPAYAVRALAAWSTLFGHVSLELFGHMHQRRPRLRRALRPGRRPGRPPTSAWPVRDARRALREGDRVALLVPGSAAYLDAVLLAARARGRSRSRSTRA